MPIELQCEVQGCPEGLEEFLARVTEACIKLEGVENAGMAIRFVDGALFMGEMIRREHLGLL